MSKQHCRNKWELCCLLLWHCCQFWQQCQSNVLLCRKDEISTQNSFDSVAVFGKVERYFDIAAGVDGALAKGKVTCIWTVATVASLMTLTTRRALSVWRHSCRQSWRQLNRCNIIIIIIIIINHVIITSWLRRQPRQHRRHRVHTNMKYRFRCRCRVCKQHRRKENT